jgi:predicted nucleic acid-binding protein
MAKYFLDTGILLGYIRAVDYAKYIEQTFEVMAPTNISYISIVTVGEIYSLAAQLHWGAATASVLNAKLLTTDRDFDHLNKEFLEVIYIDPRADYKIKD